jgi:molybdopterin-synthase adenylyltransferase
LVRGDERFKIPDRFTAIPAGPGEYRLHSLSFSLALREGPNKLLSHLLPLLDGKRTVADVVGELGSFSEDSVLHALGYLLEKGALEPADADEDETLSPSKAARYHSQTAFFSHFAVPEQKPGQDSLPGMPKSGLDYQDRVRQAHIVVFGLGRIGSQLVRSLALAGIGKITAVDSDPVDEADLSCDAWFSADQRGASRAEAVCRLVADANSDTRIEAAPEAADMDRLQALLADSDFGVLCRDDFNPAEYETFNQAALAAKKSWTSARLAGFEFQIGPTVIPFQTACYQCLDLRQKSNLPDFDEYVVVEEFLKKHHLRREALAFTPGAGLVALEVLKAITWFMAPATSSHLYTLNLLTMESKLHPVLKIPRCPACGRPGQPRPTIHAWQQSAVESAP